MKIPNNPFVRTAREIKMSFTFYSIYIIIKSIDIF